MQRGHRIVLVAHCVLNANARVRGLARYQGMHPVVALLAEKGYGVVQLPCPEMIAQGARRDPAPVEAYDTPSFREVCDGLADAASETVWLHLEAGDEVAAFVGVEGSPSCGVSTTNIGAGDGPWEPGEPTERVPGCGVFARALRERLVPLGVSFVAIDGRDDDMGVARVLRTLDGGAGPDA